MANAEQLVTAGIGAVVGFFIGGPAGAYYGFQAGLLAGALLFPAEGPAVEGPRLEDIERAESEPGAPVFKVYGRMVVPGFRMYLGRVFQISTTEEVGGKGGGQDVTTHEYYQMLVLGLCEGPIQGVGRIWENGSLKYDPRPQQVGESNGAYAARVAEANAYEDRVNIHLGTETQTADSDIEDELGTGNVPGFRGLSYLVYDFRQLKQENGLRHPVFKVECGQTTAPVFLAFNQDAGTTPNRIVRSGPGQNGMTWEWAPLDATTPQIIEQGAYSPSLRLVVAVGSNRTWVSTDNGETWTQESVINTESWRDIVWVDELALFVACAIGVTSNQIAYSSDGYNWSYASLGTDDTVQNIVWDPSVALLIAGGRDVAWTSPDAQNWTERATTQRIGDMATDGDGNICCSNRSEAGQTGGTQSTDGGLTWGNCWLPEGGGSTSIAYGDGLWLCANSTGIWSAVNPFTNASDPWTLRYTTPGTVDIEEMVYSASLQLWVAVSDRVSPSGNYIFTSSDGINWSELDHDEGEELDGVMVFEPTDAIYTTSAVIAADICAAVGITNIDTSEIADDRVLGYAVTRQVTARGALDPIRIFSQFDYVESGEQLVFRKRGGASVATLTTDDLGAFLGDRLQNGKAPPAITTRKLQDFELPRQVRLRYLSVSKEYQRGEQLSPARIGAINVKDMSLELSLALDDTLAAQLAEVVFRDAWASRYQHEFSVDQSWAKLEVADPITVPVNGRNYRMRITEIADQALGVRRISAVRDDDGAYVSVAAAVSVSQEGQVVAILSATSYEILDLPALAEDQDDAHMLVAAWATNADGSWPGATLHRSPDGGETFSPIAALSNQATVGTVVTAPSGQTFTWDDDATLVVDILNGKTLSSATDGAVLAGANALAVGADGRWCIIQFGAAELVSAGRYSLTRLLLGRRGTEHNLTSIAPDDRVVLISGPGIYEISLQTANIGFDYVYRAVTTSAAFDTGSDTTFPGSGERLEPFSPVYIRGARDGSGNLTITWLRRDRLSETLLDGSQVPMSEDSELYDVEILDGMSVVRTWTDVAVETQDYSAAEQTTDFGSAQSAISVRIYQKSAVTAVGRGTPGEATI